ncbi:MAG: SpoIIE family protein phosphatase [Candidatus Rifleibacteriota bacterium]
MSSGYKTSSSPKKDSGRRFIRWLLIVVLIWGIPSSIFWAGINLYLKDRIKQKSQEIYSELNNQLDNYIYNSAPETFFQPGFNKLFAQLKGLPANKEILERIIDEYKNTWPNQLMEIYLFNGKGEILELKGAKDEHEIFFKVINSEFQANVEILRKDLEKIGNFLPYPDLSVNYTREQKGEVINLGNPDRFSYCFYNCDKSINREFVAGILIFVHAENIKNERILNLTLQENQKKNFGFVNSDGDSNLPDVLKDLTPDELLAYFKQYPVNQFQIKNLLISLERFDEYILVAGAKEVPSVSSYILTTIIILFIIVSFIFLKLSYRIVVLELRFQHNVRQRLSGLYALCYALPLMAAAFLAVQYMFEFKHSLTAEIKQKNYRRLAEIDSSFQRFITSRLLQLRKFSKEIQEVVQDPDAIREKAKELYLNFDTDSIHVVSSASKVIYSTNLLTAEIRRHYQKNDKQRQQILESWKARHAKLSKSHIKMLFSQGDKNGRPIEPEIPKNHDSFLKLFESTAISAMEFYNRSRDILKPIKRTSSRLVVDTIIESNSQSLFQSARTNISKFTRIQGIDEIFLAYLDILPGPSKEAWYAFTALVDLVNYERQYLELLYSDLESRSEILNKIYPEEDIRAISNHSFAPNFPTVLEFKKFKTIIKRSKSDFKTFTQRMKVEGRDCLVSVLKASYMKHYVLLKVFPINQINELYNQRLYLILGLFVAVIIIGLALAKMLIKLFIEPMNDIMTGVKSLAARNYDHRIPVNSENEFGVLASAFNDSAHILKRLAISERIRKNLYPQSEYRCGSYLISTANSNSRIILSDFFDYFPLKQGNYAVILAEISGNDISAAYLTAMLKTSFTLLCPSFPDKPEFILKKLNQILLPYYEKGHLTTCFIGFINPTNDSMLCANAGQSYPIAIKHKSSDKAGSFISLPSTPLGLGPDNTFNQHEISLEDKMIVLYSDGAVNLTDKEGMRIGHEKFRQIVSEAIEKDSRNPSNAILEKLNQISMNLPWRDDITILTIQNRI